MCENTNPWNGGCNPCPPGASFGDQPHAVSWACSVYLRNRYCDSVLFDVLDALNKTEASLTPAETATVNSYLASHGCAPITTPASLAQSAYASIRFPKPSGHRSPSESELFQGLPFTYVNLWTFFWTDPSTWHPLTATASVAGMSATVTATPVALLFDPGDGSPAVTCAGPGRAWTDADGNAAPSDGACGYQYRHVSPGAFTTTQSILWQITWAGTGNTGGQIASLSTSSSGELRVMQIETVVTR